LLRKAFVRAGRMGAVTMAISSQSIEFDSTEFKANAS
jgi:hypothetical protein